MIKNPSAVQRDFLSYCNFLAVKLQNLPRFSNLTSVTMVLILFIVHDGHVFFDDGLVTGLVVAHFFVEVAVACLLQNGVQFPMMLTVDGFGSQNGSLGIALATVFGHDVKGGNLLSGAIADIDDTDAPYGGLSYLNIVIVVARVGNLPPNLLRGFCGGADIIVLISLQKLRKGDLLHGADDFRISGSGTNQLQGVGHIIPSFR